MNEIKDKCRSFFPMPEHNDKMWHNLYTRFNTEEMIKILVEAVEELQQAHNNLCDYVSNMRNCQCQQKKK